MDERDKLASRSAREQYQRMAHRHQQAADDPRATTVERAARELYWKLLVRAGGSEARAAGAWA